MLKLTNFQPILAGKPFGEPVSFRLNKGEVLAITGPNGSGKSTLLRALFGLLPAKGVIEYQGARVDRLPARVTGYVPQRFNFPGTIPITVREFFQLGASDVPSEHICDRLKLGRLFDRSLGILSGGELQRVVLARALTRNPELLVLDEASAGIDVAGQAQILELLIHLLEEHGLTVILVSHDSDELEHYKSKLGRKYHGLALGKHSH